MLRFVIFLIIFLVFSVWLGIQLQQDPGMAIFMWHGNSVEMPLWFAGILLLVGLFILWNAFALSKSLPNAFYRLKKWREQKQFHQSLKQTNAGFLSLLENRWQDALHNFNNKKTATELNTLTTLGEAYAMHKMGESIKRDNIISQADETLATKLIQADFALDDEQPEQVIKILLQYRHITAAQLRLKLAYEQLNQWENLLEILLVLQKTKIISKNKIQQQSANAAISWLASAKDLNSLQNIWRQIPKDLRKNPKVLHEFITQLIKYPNTQDAAIIHITTQLKAGFDSDLIYLFGQIQPANPNKQLILAEKWLQNYPQDINLLHTLSKIAMRCKLWGKARNWINEILMLDATNCDALAALAKLEELTDNSTSALS